MTNSFERPRAETRRATEARMNLLRQGASPYRLNGDEKGATAQTKTSRVRFELEDGRQAPHLMRDVFESSDVACDVLESGDVLGGLA